MKNSRGFYYFFSDGYTCWALGMSKIELKHEVLKHGKLVAKRAA